MSKSDGGGIADKLSHVIADTLTKHKSASIPAEQAARVKGTQAVIGAIGRDIPPQHTEALQSLLDQEQTPEWIRELAGHLMAHSSSYDTFVKTLAGVTGILALLGAVIRPEIQDVTHHFFQQNPSTSLTPDELARIIVRGYSTVEESAHEAQDSGLPRAKFEAIVNATGNAPGPQELMAALRRGIIDQARFEHGVHQSDVKNEWIDVLTRLRFSPMPAGNAVAAAVQSHLTLEQAKQKWMENGFEGDDFGPAYETAGRPPGIMEMLSLWNRSIIDEATVDQAIRESDVKNKYVGALKALRVYLPPPRTIAPLLLSGAITSEMAHTLYTDYGMTPEMANAYIESVKHRKHQSNKQLATTQITTLYEERAIQRDKAVALLKSIGWDDADTDFVLGLADNSRARKFQNAAVGTVHARYIQHHLARDKTSDALDQIGIQSTERDQLVKLWDHERDARVADLTPAQIIAAWKADVFTDDLAHTRLLRLGYSEDDAHVLMEIADAALRKKRRQVQGGP